MSRSEAEELLRDWSIGWTKVFKYHEWISAPETLIVTKDRDHVFSIDKDKSTTGRAGPWDKDEFLRLMITGVMTHQPMASVNTDYRNERTGGCDCGAWKTANPDLHSAIMPCRKYRK